MFKIVNKQLLAKDSKRLDIESPQIAKNVLPGQFVMVVTDENSEWIPITVMEADAGRGIISLIVQEVGPSTRQLANKPINEELFSVMGPLGQPMKIEKFGVVVCAATGLGVAQILPICRAFKKAGNKVIGVMGAKTRKLLMLEAQMRLSCHQLIITTDDGSYEHKGQANEIVRELLETQDINLVYTTGSVAMMKAIAGLTQKFGVKTLVKLNPMMLCGAGICGSCRVKVGGKEVLACECGPIFEAQSVDYDDLRIRKEAFASASIDQGFAFSAETLTNPESIKQMFSNFLKETK